MSLEYNYQRLQFVQYQIQAYIIIRGRSRYSFSFKKKPAEGQKKSRRKDYSENLNKKENIVESIIEISAGTTYAGLTKLFA